MLEKFQSVPEGHCYLSKAYPNEMSHSACSSASSMSSLKAKVPIYWFCFNPGR